MREVEYPQILTYNCYTTHRIIFSNRTMSVKLPPVICPYLEIMEQHKKYTEHAKRVTSARSTTNKSRREPRQFSYYLSKYKDTDQATRLKRPRQIQSARGQQTKNMTKSRQPSNWMTQLNDVILPRNQNTVISPSAVLLFPSPTVPNTRTPETLRRIIDDSGMRVLDESPLSARDSYYAKDIESLKIKPPGPAFNVRPSPRPKSMRRPERTEIQSLVYRPKVSQSERQQRPDFRYSLLDQEDEEQKRYEEQKQKLNNINWDDFNLDKFNVDTLHLDSQTSNSHLNLIENTENQKSNDVLQTTNSTDINLDDILQQTDDLNKIDTDENVELGDLNDILNNDDLKKLDDITAEIHDDVDLVNTNINDDLNIEGGEDLPKRETVVKFKLPEEYTHTDL